MNDQTIGQYRIINKIGEGGMGTVFEAEQQHPQRRVALKVIKGGQYVDETAVKMFQREAQSLALLKHPSIASIYESGRTEEGQHFFAMELVKGIELKEWLDKRGYERLSPDEIELRLALFWNICNGVAYAHQRGVIHRDLKPANILVLEEEPDDTGPHRAQIPDIKILDFGLARITESDTSAATMVTEVGVMLGTLSYMSPEQVRGISADIDVRSDVYALGMILYEMLAGQLPYDLREEALHEAARIILEVPPRPISKVWSGTRRLDRDLEVITQKALEKDPSRRYQTALALADDIERYATSQPIQARPPSAVYQLQKMIKRHTVPFSLAASMVVLIITFAFVSVAQARRAERARDESEAVTTFVTDMLAAADPTELGRDVLVQDILEIAEEDVDSKFDEQPLIQARLHHTIGIVYHSLGQYPKAVDNINSAIEIRRRELGDEDPNTLQSRYHLGKALVEQDRLEEAEPLVIDVLEKSRSAMGTDDYWTLHAQNLLVVLYLYQMRLEEAEPFAVDGLQKWDNRLEMLGEEATEKDREGRHTALGSLFGIYLMQGRFEEAEPMASELIEGDILISGPEDAYTLADMHNVAYMYQLMGHLAEADSLYSVTLELRRRIEGPEHGNTLGTMGNLAEVYALQGRYEEAEALFTETIENYTRTMGEEHQRALRYMNGLADLLTEQGKHAEAETVYTRILNINRRILPEGDLQVLVAQSRLGACLAELGRYSVAERMLEEAYTGIVEAIEEPDDSLRDAVNRIIRLYELWENPDKAAEWRDRLPPDMN